MIYTHSQNSELTPKKLASTSIFKRIIYLCMIDYNLKNSSMYHWIEGGCAREKLNIGIPTYGRF